MGMVLALLMPLEIVKTSDFVGSVSPPIMNWPFAKSAALG